jgi:hypothetical protein
MLQNHSPEHEPGDDSTIIDIHDVLNPTVISGVTYWRSLRGSKRFPSRADLTLRKMAAILPYSVIVSVLGCCDDYEFKFVGDAQRQAFGMYFKGIRVSQIQAALPRVGALLHTAYAQVCSSGMPFAVRGRVDPEPSGSVFQYHETAFLPLGVDDKSVDHLLIVGVYVPEPFWDVSEAKMTMLANSLRSKVAIST